MVNDQPGKDIQWANFLRVAPCWFSSCFLYTSQAGELKPAGKPPKVGNVEKRKLEARCDA